MNFQIFSKVTNVRKTVQLIISNLKKNKFSFIISLFIFIKQIIILHSLFISIEHLIILFLSLSSIRLIILSFRTHRHLNIQSFHIIFTTSINTVYYLFLLFLQNKIDNKSFLFLNNQSKLFSITFIPVCFQQQFSS